MNKLILLPILSILSIGCAQSFQVEQGKEFTVAPELLHYVEQFQLDAANTGRPIAIDNLVVIFDTLPDRTIANCTRSSYSSPTIRFNTAYYNYYMSQGLESDIEQVMYHELGHCILGLSHNDTRSGPYNWPSSIMNTYHFSGSLYMDYKDNYLRQLFLNENNNFDSTSFSSKVFAADADKYYNNNEVGIKCDQ